VAGVAAPARRAAPTRPLTVSTLGVLQFLVAAAAVIVVLGIGSEDGELSVADVALAVGAACVGGAVFSATWAGGRIGWWCQLVLAALGSLWGLVTLLTDRAPGAPAFVVGVLWLALALLPASRTWFLRPLA
jgi:hypothetical protein